MKGVVVKSTGSWFNVLQEDGSIISCKLRGNFRIKGLKATNPIAVGDRVEFQVTGNANIGQINNILPRFNYIIRKATNLSKVFHIIAANIDQAMLVITVAQPRTSQGFIDRFLTTAEAYHIPAYLVFNKTDIYNKELQNIHNEYIHIYSTVGYPCISISAVTGNNLQQLRQLFANKVTLFSGHSGVGKTAILNALDPALGLREGEISSYHAKGVHTTTFAEMHALSSGGLIIDTPGIKEFGLIDFNKNEIAERFPEMRALMHLCHFSNCTHIHEPGCAVKSALKEGKIFPSRYYNYLSIYNGEDFPSF
ncbi:MAG: ribosome small subunit-dependent GTPase A [Lentimicrobiaceae bacterium]|nr:ribosome small subunit-dependent GTPase A [Lentimicrobiaceae bacterium]